MSNNMINTLLNQGKRYMALQRRYKPLAKLKLIEETTSPKLGSIIESLANMSDGDNNGDNNGDDQFEILQKSFQDLLRRYNEATEEQVLRASHSKNSEKQIKKVENINKQLLNILREMDLLVEEKMAPKKQIGDIGLKEHTGNLADYEKTHKMEYSRLRSLIGDNIDGHRRTKSAYYHYLVWLLVAITMAALSFKHLSKNL